jgi:hypothetical protein
MEDLNLERTWKNFYSLGDWVKNLPKLLHTLHDSENEEEVTVARKIIVFEFQAAFERKENKDNEAAYKLCDLLTTVIKFVFKILATDALQKGMLLSNIIDLTHLINGSRTNEIDWLTPLYHLFAIYDDITNIFAQAEIEKDLLFLQGCCYLMANRKTLSSDRDAYMIEKSISIIEKYGDDVTQACAIFAMYGILDNGMVRDEVILDAISSAEKVLKRPDISLSKLAAAILIASKHYTESSHEIAFILADYSAFIKDYNLAFSESPFKHQQLPKFIQRVVPRLPPVIEWFADRAVQNLEFIEKSEESLTAIVKCVELFLEIICKDQIISGMKVTDLPPYVTRALHQLVKMDKIWEIEGINEKLTRCGILSNTKESLQAFLEDTKDDGVKKFPKFEGIEKINWADLNDAYGPATKIPMALRKLISNDASTRSEGWNVMHSNVLHQGTLYPATPYVTPFLMEILDSPHALEKDRILKFIVHMMCCYFNEYLYSSAGYDIDVDYPAVDDPEDYGRLIRQVHEHLKKDINILFKLLLHQNSAVSTEAAMVLALLHKSADLGAVPKLKEAIEKQDDWSAKGRLLWALSFLYPKVAPRDECVAYFMNHWKEFEAKGSLHAYVAAALARFFMEGEAAPKFLVEVLVDIFVFAGDGEETADVAIRTLKAIKSELALPGLLQKFKELQSFQRASTLVATLLDIAFKFELTTNNPIIGSALKPHQIEVLQVFVDSPRMFDFISPFNFTTRRLPATVEQLAILVEEAQASKEVDNDME